MYRGIERYIPAIKRFSPLQQSTNHSLYKKICNLKETAVVAIFVFQNEAQSISRQACVMEEHML